MIRQVHVTRVVLLDSMSPKFCSSRLMPVPDLLYFGQHYKTHGCSVRFEFHNECDTLDKSERTCRTFALHFDEIHATLGVSTALSPDVDAVHIFCLCFMSLNVGALNSVRNRSVV